MAETRLAVPGVAGYLVSDMGNVYSLWKREWSGERRPGGFRGSRTLVDPLGDARLLTQFDRRLRDGKTSGYRSVKLAHPRPTNRYVHELVLLAFVGPRPSPDHEACHGPGGRADNRLSNLRWGTTRENYEDRVECGTQYEGDAWRMARGLLPSTLEGTLIGEPDHALADRQHAFADLLEAAE